MNLETAKNLVHTLDRTLGTLPGAMAYATFDRAHEAEALAAKRNGRPIPTLDEAGAKRRIVERVKILRQNSYVTTNEHHRELVALADDFARELGIGG
jgi:hypothetical protein